MRKYFAVILWIMISSVANAECTIAFPQYLCNVKLYDYTHHALLFTVTSGDSKFGKGVYSIVDEDTGNILWSQKVDYATDNVDIYGNIVVHTQRGKVMILDLETGAVLRKLKITPAYIDFERDMIVGSRSTKGKKMDCFRISDGERLWYTDIPDGGACNQWNLVDMLGNNIIILGKNLYNLDWSTGALRVYRMNDRDSRTAANIAGLVGFTALGMVSGVFAGVAVVPYGMPFSEIGQLHSNVLKDSELYFIADRRHVACLDSAMNEVWSYTMTDNSASLSRLHCSGDTLFMLNEGVGFLQDGYSMKKGKIFTAAFNKTTGELLFMNRWANKWDKSVFGEELIFVRDEMYAINSFGNHFTPVVGDGYKYPVYSPGGDVLMVNKDITITDQHIRDDLYRKVTDVDSMMIVRQISDTPDFYLISPDGDVIRRFPLEYSWIFSNGSKICIECEDKLIFTDINSVMNRY